MSDTTASRSTRRGKRPGPSVREMQANARVTSLLKAGFKPEVGEDDKSAVRRLFIEAAAKDRKRRAAKRRATKNARKANR